ncbi:MAG: hypothetical protein D6729_08270 [Deltaproteobacteria bacterium]|nr:MAG: hypothetical protein D6729_08270 [Deltaproteobacteria bacterium]
MPLTSWYVAPRGARWLGLAGLACAGLVAGCSPTADLEHLPLDEIDARIEAPTGALEETDPMRLAYSVLETAYVVESLETAAEVIPGLDRFRLFDRMDAERCHVPYKEGALVDYTCLGFPSGTLRLIPVHAAANENGDYDLHLSSVSLDGKATLFSDVRMRVEGIANPLVDEMVRLSVRSISEGLPRRYDSLDSTGIRLDNTADAERMDCVTEVYGETFAFQLGAVRFGERVEFELSDARNLWECHLDLEGARVTGGQCQTPQGEGDWAVLRF